MRLEPRTAAERILTILCGNVDFECWDLSKLQGLHLELVIRKVGDIDLDKLAEALSELHLSEVGKE